jgi:hypothetical protein
MNRRDEQSKQHDEDHPHRDLRSNGARSVFGGSMETSSHHEREREQQTPACLHV